MANHLCLGPLPTAPALEALLLHVGPPGLRAEGSVTSAVSQLRSSVAVSPWTHGTQSRQYRKAES